MGHSKFTPQTVQLTTAQLEHFTRFWASKQLAKCDLPDATAKALVRKSLIAEQGNEWHLTECGTAYLDYLSGATP